MPNRSPRSNPLLQIVAGVVAATVALLVSFGAAAADLREHSDFRLLNPPMAVEAKGRVEVVEFFWYGCPHCFDFEPVLGAWQKKLPPDVAFRRVPAIFPNNKWAPGARLFYTLEAMNLTEKLHTAAFHAIHQERIRLDDDFVLFDWVAKQGVDKARFREVYVSFAVNTRVQQAREATAAAGLGGVPAVVVQGRYQAITPGSYEDLLGIIERLIERARRESNAAAGKA